MVEGFRRLTIIAHRPEFRLRRPPHQEDQAPAQWHRWRLVVDIRLSYSASTVFPRIGGHVISQSFEAIATAFSRHEFEDTYTYLADDVQWRTIGGELLYGKDAVMKSCNESTSYLSGVATTFTRLRAIVCETSIVIDSEATYTETTGGTSAVASCDIYDFGDGKVRSITSYNVGLDGAE